MADDSETLREVWDGKITVSFILASDEVVSLEEPEQFFLILSRMTYFPLVTDKVQKHFVKYINQEQRGELWFEDEFGVPMQWHYPIGVLFDLTSRETKLPWTLTVHFQKFPEDTLLHCTSKEAVESVFISMVKEADFLKHRGEVMNTMKKDDHKQLWLGLFKDKFDQFWSINRKLMAHSENVYFRYIPFRIHQPQKPFVQTLFRPTSNIGQEQTLKDLLMHALPNVIDLDRKDKYDILIQGIRPSLDTPVQWLSEHLSHPDNFLHICLLST